MKKKILCILQLPPPVHGASMMNSYVVNSSVLNEGFDLTVIDLQFSKSVDKLKKFSLSKVFKALNYGFIIVAAMIRVKPDVVYYNLYTKGFAFYRDAFYVSLIKLFKTKIVFHLHSKGIKNNAGGSSLKSYIYKHVFNNTNTICLSKTLTADIEEVNKSTPFIVPNGIPAISGTADLFKKDATIIPQMLYLSNYMQDKGLLVLINALKIVKEKGYNFSARLVGAPTDISIEMLEGIITEKDLAQFVNIIGPKYGQGKIEEFRNADLFVFPSFDEAFPLVLLEAMQFGIPVISTLVGGIPDMIIDNETGILVNSRDVDMLADKIVLLLENPALRTELGANGYIAFKANYTLPHFEQNMFETFKLVLSN